jgi:hypothetical protein
VIPAAEHCQPENTPGRSEISFLAGIAVYFGVQFFLLAKN